MAACIAHRGPDADGFYSKGPVGLAHRRLSILDLSERGRQPMSTLDGRYTIVFNGEIYNYLELRTGLQADGHHFSTDTDTEVLLALYALEGADCLVRLNGMFAFAIWDDMRQELFVARDRIGIKPLYFNVTADHFAFASEAKALFAAGVRREVDEAVIETFMTFGYVPGERTLFRNIRKLLPGYYVRVRDGRLSTTRYWDLEYQPDHARSAGATAEQLRTLMADAMRIHMRSDVPVGVFLSGGLDSSAIVAMLADSGVSNMRTFSVAYEGGPEYDETRFARLVADRFATDHHVLYVDPREFVDFIPDYVWHMDEPVTEAAALSLYFVSRLLRKHVTVALSGEGADELFGGYQIYRYMGWLERYRRIPEWFRHAVVARAAGAAGHQKLSRYLALADLPLERRYLGVSLHDVRERQSVLDPAFQAPVPPEQETLGPFYEKTSGRDALTRMLYADLKTWLVDDLLIKADKMTMANGVELRVPFLDHRVVEFAATIPSNLKIRGGDVKWILKKAMATSLPEIILRRRKQGFPTPLAMMFRQDMSAYLRDLLLSPRLTARGYFRRPRIEQLIREHLSGASDHHKVLWQLVVLEEWHCRFIDADPMTASGRVERPAAVAAC